MFYFFIRFIVVCDVCGIYLFIVFNVIVIVFYCSEKFIVRSEGGFFRELCCFIGQIVIYVSKEVVVILNVKMVIVFQFFMERKVKEVCCVIGDVIVF